VGKYKTTSLHSSVSNTECEITERKVYTSSKVCYDPIWRHGWTNQVCARTGVSVICWAGKAGIVFCICAAVAATAILREKVDQPPSVIFWCGLRVRDSEKAVHNLERVITYLVGGTRRWCVVRRVSMSVQMLGVGGCVSMSVWRSDGRRVSVHMRRS
jgi:hypothetical protein